MEPIHVAVPVKDVGGVACENAKLPASSNRAIEMSRKLRIIPPREIGEIPGRASGGVHFGGKKKLRFVEATFLSAVYALSGTCASVMEVTVACESRGIM